MGSERTDWRGALLWRVSLVEIVVLPRSAPGFWRPSQRLTSLWPRLSSVQNISAISFFFFERSRRKENTNRERLAVRSRRAAMSVSWSLAWMLSEIWHGCGWAFIMRLRCTCAAGPRGRLFLSVSDDCSQTSRGRWATALYPRRMSVGFRALPVRAPGVSAPRFSAAVAPGVAAPNIY